MVHQKVIFIGLKTVIQNNEIVNPNNQIEGITYIYTTENL